MAWYTGKSALVGIALGDSNMVGAGGFEIGVQAVNGAVQCYATSATIPYDPSELTWQNLDPNGTSRYAQMYETLVTQNTTYIGQVLGGNGAAAMQMADTLQRGTACDAFYLYQGAHGGTTADNWANGGNWTTMATYLPQALSEIPGSPTYADVIFISLGTNDKILAGQTAEQSYTNMATLRSKMVEEGWWVPGTTQIVLMDTPRTAIMGNWNGVDLIRRRFNDRILVGKARHYTEFTPQNRNMQRVFSGVKDIVHGCLALGQKPPCALGGLLYSAGYPANCLALKVVQD